MWLSDILDLNAKFSENGGVCKHLVQDSSSSSSSSSEFFQIHTHDEYEWIVALVMFLAALLMCELGTLILSYPQNYFYRQEWSWVNHQDFGENHHYHRKIPDSKRLETIQNSLHTWQFTSKDMCRMNKDDCSCPICLVNFEPDDSVSHSKTSCQHLFHEHCIKQWMQMHLSCPYCRQDLTRRPAPKDEAVEASTRRLEPEVAREGSVDNLSLLVPWPRDTPPNDPAFCLFVF